MVVLMQPVSSGPTRAWWIRFATYVTIGTLVLALAILAKREYDVYQVEEKKQIEALFDPRVALVTGGDSEMGVAIVEGLVRNHATVCVFLQKFRQNFDDPLTKQRQISRYDTLVQRKQVVLFEGDIFTWQGVNEAVKFVDTTFGRLDVVVNAATMGVPDPVAAEGAWDATGTAKGERVQSGLKQPIATKVTPISEEFAVNVLLHYRLIYATTELMARTMQMPNIKDSARVVQVASLAAGGADFRDLSFAQRHPTPQAVFESNMQVLRMMPYIWAPKLTPLGITVNSCHPGTIADRRKPMALYQLFRGRSRKTGNYNVEGGDVGLGVSEAMRRNVQTCVEVATSRQPDVQGQTARWYVDGRPINDDFANMSEDQRIVDTLFSSMDGMTGEVKAPALIAGGAAVKATTKPQGIGR
ncbi:hypothetical protein PPROV_000933800 [Pycnococcus provasolii]|uniref:Uncharacterized protein n=1 Tax=Pycnococcus provasolii TaxID=41880 RepID=A0A830I0F0_9CHLO|nr:hypothetical protein PPROV_000933800 [Pycnococcus provasolii]